MFVIRPIHPNDLEQLYQLAEESGIGLTSLPANEAQLKSRIKSSQQAFSSQADTTSNQSYLFVIEDTQKQQIVGTSGIESAVGLHDPFYHYHLGKVVHASRELGVHNTVEILTFCNDYTGVSEICSLFLRESARKNGVGKLLSKSRFLFMAQHPKRFSKNVIAELRGVSDENGRSPFWEWLEKHFFSVDFPTADYLTGIGNKVFIAELMPKYPIYVNLLSDEAQDCIGKVHDKTRPAQKLLHQEGFICRGYVDIFDAGPTVEAELENIKTVRKSNCATVRIIEEISDDSFKDALITNIKVKQFRACMGKIRIVEPKQALISYEVAKALKLKNGDSIRYIFTRHT